MTRQAQVGWLLSVKQHVTEINRYCIVLLYPGPHRAWGVAGSRRAHTAMAYISGPT